MVPSCGLPPGIVLLTVVARDLRLGTFAWDSCSGSFVCGRSLFSFVWELGKSRVGTFAWERLLGNFWSGISALRPREIRLLRLIFGSTRGT